MTSKLKTFLFSNTARQSFLIALLVFLSAPVFSHTLIMKDGSIIVGKIKNQSKTEVIIEINGVKKTYPKTKIKQIEFVDRKPVKKKKKTAPKKVVEKEKKIKPPSQLTMTGIMWRSAVLPGWGHYKIEKKFSAAGYLFLNLAAFGYSASQRKSAVDLKNAYENQSLVNFAIVQSTAPPGGDPLIPLMQNFILGIDPYNKYQNQVIKYNQSFYLLGAVYIGQLIHAWFNGKNFLSGDSKNQINKESDKKTGWNFIITPSDKILHSGKTGLHSHFSFYQRF